MVVTKLTPEWINRYRRAGYRVIGERMHSAVEICRWTKSRLRGGRNCYKSIYGIDSRRCIQMTPTLDLCNFACPWCWRPFGEDRHKFHGREWDDPKVIIDDMIAAQRELLSGFGGNPKTSKESFELAMRPAHVAISLDGEPTYYPYLPELVKEIKRRGMTVFLVTNGTVPQRLRDLLEQDAIPTNLFISVYATNPEDYAKVTRSVVPDPFKKVVESLSLMDRFNERGCRTIFRMTVVKGLNMKDPEGYASLIKLSRAQFVEVKGYAWLGESRMRLPQSASPSYPELLTFAEKVTELAGYTVKMRDRTSNIIVAVRDEEVWKRNVALAKEISHLPGVPFSKRR